MHSSQVRHSLSHASANKHVHLFIVLHFLAPSIDAPFVAASSLHPPLARHQGSTIPSTPPPPSRLISLAPLLLLVIRRRLMRLGKRCLSLSTNSLSLCFNSSASHASSKSRREGGWDFKACIPRSNTLLALSRNANESSLGGDSSVVILGICEPCLGMRRPGQQQFIDSLDASQFLSISIPPLPIPFPCQSMTSKSVQDSPMPTLAWPSSYTARLLSTSPSTPSNSANSIHARVSVALQVIHRV